MAGTLPKWLNDVLSFTPTWYSSGSLALCNWISGSTAKAAKRTANSSPERFSSLYLQLFKKFILLVVFLLPIHVNCIYNHSSVLQF